MNEVLKKNMELLERFQPNVFQKLMLYEKGRLELHNQLVERILFARQDEIIINMLVVSKGQEYVLCDHENPINEAYDWIDKYADPSNKTDIVFGIGFGYHLEVLITSFKNKKLIIIEPNMDLFYQLISVRNLELIIKNSEIYLDEHIDTVLERLNRLFWDTENGGIQCQPLEIYAGIFKEAWDELRSKFIRQAQSFTVDFATRKAFGELWAYNNIRNAGKLYGASNAGGLVGAFEGVPAVLVSAGPSLAKNAHHINAIKDKCIIMAAGAAINKLEKMGITPHFMVGIDASDEEADIHRAVRSKDIYFIYSNQVSTGSVDGYEGPKFFMNYPIDMFSAEFLRYAGIPSEFFLSGPSVANTCFDILFKMGCNPIILIGQDLSYPDMNMRNKEGMVRENNIYGEPVYTNAVLLSMRNWFEGCFEKARDRVEIINATEGGLDIQFAGNGIFEDVIKRLDFKEVCLADEFKRIYEAGRFPESITARYDEYKKTIGLEIDRLYEYCSEQYKIVGLIEKGVYHPGKNSKAFNKMAARVSEITSLTVNSRIYNTLLKNILDIDFYLIKLEVDRATENLKNYDDVRDVYTKAMKYQSDLLKEKLMKLREYLSA